jgi:hypothetical protein
VGPNSILACPLKLVVRKVIGGSEADLVKNPYKSAFLAFGRSSRRERQKPMSVSLPA